MPTDLLAWPVTPGIGGVGSWLSIKPRPATSDMEHMTTKRSIWKAVSFTLTAAHPKLFSNIIPPKLLARWIIRSGVPDTVSRLKELSFAYRIWAVDRRRPANIPGIPHSFQAWLRGHCSSVTARAQVGRLGRLLPKPPTKVVERAVREWKERVKATPNVSAFVVDDIFDFGARFARENRHLLRLTPRWEPSDSSATALTSIAAGGRRAELYNDARHLLDPDNSGRFGSSYVWGRDPFRVSPNVDRLMVEASIGLMEAGVPSPKILPVPEFGWKTRVLTLFPNRFLTPGDLIRSQIWPMIEGQAWVDTDRVPSVDKFRELLRRSKDRAGRWVSSDLSSATDYIPFEYSASLWKGILSELNAPAWVHRYIDKMFGPMITHCGSRINRGTQMGTPLSFSTLTLLHRYAVEASGNSDHPHLIRGDDFIGLLPNPSAYIRSMERMGFRINKTKTIISSFGGTFAERTFTSHVLEIANQRHGFLYSPRRLRKGTLVVIGAKISEDIPLRGIVHAGEGQAGRSKLLLLGQIKEQLWPEFIRESRRRLILRLLAVGNKALLLQARKAGVPVSVAITLGGASVPRPAEVRRTFIPLWLRSRLGTLMGSNRLAEDQRMRFASLKRRAQGMYTSLVPEYLRILDEIPLGERVPVFEPLDQPHFRNWARREEFFNPFAGDQLPPMAFAHWARSLRRIPPVGKRWAASGSEAELIHKMIIVSVVYVPITPSMVGPISVLPIDEEE